MKKGGKHTEDTKGKISQACLGKSKVHRTKVLQGKPFLAYRVGEIKSIGKYNSVQQAAQELGDASTSCIHECLHGDRESTKGYWFVYEENLLVKRGTYRYLDLEKLKQNIDPSEVYKANPAHVAEPERLVTQIINRQKYKEEFKALVLRLLDKYQDLKKVSQLCCVSEQTIYVWLVYWNESQGKTVHNQETQEEENR